MRLVCPNCGAQYEVDARVMPEAGRDVQCSNCGHTWFQEHPDAAVNAPPPPLQPEIAEPPRPAAPAPQPEEQPSALSDAPAPQEPASQSPDAKTPVGAAARPLDDHVRDILREEASREITARQSEQTKIETQTDLGLEEALGKDASEKDEPEIDEMVASAISSEPHADPRDNFPDIEEINSTLDEPHDGADAGGDDSEEIVAQRRSGFRTGFLLIVLLAIILLAIYVFAPTIVEKVPQLRPVLESYVGLVDQGRAGLEDAMRAATEKMQSMIEKPEEG